MEVFLQVALQVALLLLTQTLTATHGGLETFFAQDEMFNIPMSPTIIITLSVILSLKTSILLHVKILGMEKGGYFSSKAILYNQLFVAFSTLIFKCYSK